MLKKLFFFLVGILLITACQTSTSKKTMDSIDNPPINLTHFQHLYKEIEINEVEMGIMHIYSEYPDYQYNIEPKEGFTCVDDVARAIVFLSEFYKKTPKKEHLKQIKKMLEFLLYMQNENGYFNNFIWHDYSINTSYQTTIAELNWWSLRAFWAMENAYPIIEKDKELANRVNQSIERLLKNILRDLPLSNRSTKQSFGMEIPTWLPQQFAGDQAAILMLSLLENYKRSNNPKVKEMLMHQADGLLLLQRGSADQYPYGAFMSWDNLWHAWGNSQAYALLKVGDFFKKQKYVQAGLEEVKYFYPYLLKNGFAEAFWITHENGEILETKRNEFPQIAYGIRPMVWASLEAYRITRKEDYLIQAKQLSNWLLDKNIVGTKLYDEKTGRCFDGISSTDSINKNSGAESTIECLLALHRLNRYVYK